jgi:ribosomal protein S27E
MKIMCLSCGHTLDMFDAYDDYQGRVKCYVCGALMTIHTEAGQVKSAAAVEEHARGAKQMRQGIS